MKTKRITALILIMLMPLCVLSCSQRKASPGGEQKQGEQSDKGYLIFINADTPEKYVLYSAEVEGKKKTKLYEKNPFSAAGYTNKIVFVAKSDSKQGLYMVKADGSELTTIISNIDIKENTLSWSPAGDKLTFIAKGPQDSVFQVYYVETGKNKTPIKVTNDNNTKESPRFSVDGKNIIYTEGNGSNFDIVKHDIGLLKYTNLSGGNAVNDVSPTISPDGTRIFFLSDEKSKGKLDLYSMTLDGTNRTPLTTGLNIEKDTLRVSPNSSMVSFIILSDKGSKSIQVIDMNRATVMISNDAYISTWSGDSKKLYFATFDPTNRKIVEYDITAKKMKDAFKIEYKPGEESTGIKFLHFTEKLK
jgi:Periplasmic component of the Tol biopolymer transport system